MDQRLERTTFQTSRLLEFFTTEELTMQIGHPQAAWAVALLKELIDNSLDACETANIVPRIEVMVSDDSFSVRDYGPGLPAQTLERSLDYAVRVSDKVHYASPTRGRLGNALKCVWAAPFVVDGQHGCVEVASHGRLRRIDVTLDAIAQEPRIAVTDERSGVKSGAFFHLHWPASASCLGQEKIADFYSAVGLLRGYAAFNPHASFRLCRGTESLQFPARNRGWQKWRPDWPTSPHWYNAEGFAALIGAYLAEQRRTGRARSVRDFIAEFDGLTGSATLKHVLEEARLTAASLENLSDGSAVNTAAARP